MRYRLKDDPKQKNYYISTARFKTTIGDMYVDEKGPNKYKFTDKNKNGKKVNVHPDHSDFRMSHDNSSEKIEEVCLKICNVDENYYKYIESIDRQRSMGSNPFFEPIIIDSNIQGGIGVFCSFTQLEKIIQIKK